MEDNSSSETWEKVETPQKAPLEKNQPKEKKKNLDKEIQRYRKHHVSKTVMYFNILLSLIAGGMIGFFAFWYTLGPKTEVLGSKSSSSLSATPLPTPSSQAQGTAEPARSENIIVDAPRRGSGVKSPIHITGQARVFKSVLSARLKGPSGKTIAEDKILTEQGEVGKMHAFSAFLPYPRQKAGERGTLEVFTKAQTDGKEEDLIQIPVIFEK